MNVSRDELDRILGKKKEGRIKGVAPKEQRTYDGIVFDSRREMLRYKDLSWLREVGIVKWFLRQVPFDLPGGVRYRADFLIVWDSGAVTVEDVKGHRTEVYKLKKRQVEALYGIVIAEV